MNETTSSTDPDVAIGPAEEDVTQPLRVEARTGFTIWIEFADGSTGILDLSYLADQPAFTGWADRAFFESVHINHDLDVIEWGDELQLCQDALYLKLTGKSAEDIFPTLRASMADA